MGLAMIISNFATDLHIKLAIEFLANLNSARKFTVVENGVTA